MKLFADYSINNGYKRINIWDIYNGYKAYNNSNAESIDFKEYYSRFYKNRLYSTHKKTKVKMSLTVRHPYGKSFFKYQADLYKNGNAESFSHSVYKDIIADMKVLNLSTGNRNIKLYVYQSEIEVAFEANNNLYVADVFVYFNKSEPEIYYKKWNGQLCFEIKNTHAVDSKKINDCKIEKIPVFEHTISSKLMIDNSLNSEEELLNQKQFITEKLSNIIYGKLLSDPNCYNFVSELKEKEKKIYDLENKLNTVMFQYKELLSEHENYRNQNEKNALNNFSSSLFSVI